MNGIEKVEREIQQNRIWLNQEVAKVRADEQLTPSGRHERIAELKNKASDRHQELVRNRQAAILQEQENIYNRAFRRGIGSIDSYRDLYGRAAATDEKGLQQLKQQAVNTGDTILLQTVHHVAYDRNFLGLLNDAPDIVKALVEFEYDYGIRAVSQIADSSRAQHIERNLERRQAIAAPYVSGA